MTFEKKIKAVLYHTEKFVTKPNPNVTVYKIKIRL